MDIKTDVTMTGPLTDGSASRFLVDAVRGSINEITQSAESFLLERLRPRPDGVFLSVGMAKAGQASTGNYRRNISSTVKNNVGVISDNGVIYGPWLEGTSSRNTTTRFAGYASFRAAGQEVEKMKKRILQAHVSRFVRRIN